MHTFLCIILVPVSALTWATTFVVWDGKVYEVTDDEVIEKCVGKVETEANQDNGRFYGNASNVYKFGTPYHRAQGESVDEVLAVKDGRTWKRAIYTRQAPFRLMNYINELKYLLIFIGVVVVWMMWKKKRSRD